MDYKRNIVQANKREVKIVNEFISFGVSIPCIINTSHVHYVTIILRIVGSNELRNLEVKLREFIR